MRKWIIYIIIAVLILGAGGWFVSQRMAAGKATNDAPTETAVVIRDSLALTVEGTGSLGPVTQISLAFKSGGRLAEVLVTRGQMVAAGDALARLDSSELELQLAIAQQTLILQTATLDGLLNPDPSQIAAAEANLGSAYLNYLQQAGGITDAVAAEQRLTDATALRDEAQSAYDAIADKQSTEAAEQWRILQNALIEVAAAQSDYDLAQAGMDTAAARAAWAQVVSTEKALRDLRTPPTQKLDSAEAQVEQARLNVELAQLRLTEATLVTPWAGTVTSVRAQAGEFIGSGAPLVELAQLDSLQVVINLDETDVSRITMGQTADLTLDALSSVKLTGEVIDIAPTATVQSGVVLYPVTIRLDLTDLPLRPGMTANATITVENRENTLIVPFRAVETEGGQAFVSLQTDAGSQRVPVTLGLITNTQIEILSGLSEGDLVAVYANPVQDTALQNGMGDIFGGGK